MAIRTSRYIEHEQSQDGGLARAGGRPKTSSLPCPIHPHMASRTDTSVGAPPCDNNPLDASSPLPTDPTKQHGNKSFPVPKVSWGMQGHHDPASGAAVMGEAKRDITDFAALPQAVSGGS